MEGEKHYQISPELMMINFFSLFLNVSSCGYSLQKKKKRNKQKDTQKNYRVTKYTEKQKGKKEMNCSL